MRKHPWPVLIVSISGHIIGQKKMTRRLGFIESKGGNYSSAGLRTRRSIIKGVDLEEISVKI